MAAGGAETGRADVGAPRKRKRPLPPPLAEAGPGAGPPRRRGHGEPDGEGRAQHPRHQPAVPGGEDHPHPHLRVQVLEGGVLRPHGYVRMLGALYMRLTGTAIDCYKYLEPLYNDYRKIKSQNRNGEFELMHVDEFIDELLHEERVCDIILPRLQKRYVLEEAEQLEPRVSALEEDMDDVESSEEEEEEDEKLERAPSPDHRRRGYRDLDKPRRSPVVRYRRSRSRSPRRRSRSPKRRSPSPRRERHRSKSPRRHRSRSRERRHRSRSKSPGHHRSHRHRSHSKSPERSKKSHKKSRRGNE
ncbi:pre-mRNA-splicing factor 38A isoform X2 [Apteryx rowi]|uniref:pre-mRNA-splicing factor 38A isoform X2 n=1 Tax=Apteryx rowi TaxID=308060 RepID=UPI000E1D069F|nr:pre-mRNA-splicing factor 38A isoform X2 [Apteryx rowi]